MQLQDAEGAMGRAFGFIGTVVVMAVGMYLYSTQLKTPLRPAEAPLPLERLTSWA